MRVGLDLDGVIALTPFGRLAVQAPAPVEDLPANYGRLYEAPRRANPLRLALERARFGWRSAAPDAEAALRELSALHELHIVTGRSASGASATERWLRAKGLRQYVAGVYMAPPGLRPPQHKLAVARLISLDAHIDDDPRTAYHLARNGVASVYLLDHADAHGDAPLPPNVTLVRSLREFAEKIGAG